MVEDAGHVAEAEVGERREGRQHECQKPGRDAVIRELQAAQPRGLVVHLQRAEVGDQLVVPSASEREGLEDGQLLQQREYLGDARVGGAEGGEVGEGERAGRRLGEGEVEGVEEGVGAECGDEVEAGARFGEDVGDLVVDPVAVVHDQGLEHLAGFEKVDHLRGGQLVARRELQPLQRVLPGLEVLGVLEGRDGVEGAGMRERRRRGKQDPAERNGEIG